MQEFSKTTLAYIINEAHHVWKPVISYLGDIISNFVNVPDEPKTWAGFLNHMRSLHNTSPVQTGLKNVKMTYIVRSLTFHHPIYPTVRNVQSSLAKSLKVIIMSRAGNHDTSNNLFFPSFYLPPLSLWLSDNATRSPPLEYDSVKCT